MMKHIIVLVTCCSQEQASEVARAVLNKRLAACVNIIKDVDSLFHWQGKIDQAREFLLIVKTRGDLFDRLCETVRETHSYVNPEILALPIVLGSSDYLDWIEKETDSPH